SVLDDHQVDRAAAVDHLAVAGRVPTPTLRDGHLEPGVVLPEGVAGRSGRRGRGLRLPGAGRRAVLAALAALVALVRSVAGLLAALVRRPTDRALALAAVVALRHEPHRVQHGGD